MHDDLDDPAAPDAPPPDARSEAKARTVGIFERSSATYDDVGVEFFSRFGRTLVERAGIGPGDRVLDVGCGRGAVLFAAADAVGGTGSVLGIDLAAGMVERTARQAEDLGLAQVSVRVGDAEAPAVDAGSFDAVLLGLVIFFLPDHAAALDAYRDALVADGVLAFTTFGAEDERFASVFGAVAAHIPAPPGQTASAKTPARAQDGPFAESGQIAALLAGHGFVAIEQVEETYEIEFRDGEQWIEWSWSHGARALWEAVPETERGAAHADALVALAALTPARGPLTHRWVVRYTTARTPG